MLIYLNFIQHYIKPKKLYIFTTILNSTRKLVEILTKLAIKYIISIIF